MSSIIDLFQGVAFTLLPLVSVIGLWIGSLYDQRLANVIYKLHLLRTGVANLLMSKDRKWKKQPDSEFVRKYLVESKEVIFIRHGESKWNLVFNKGFNLSFPGRLFSALAGEATQLTTLDSVFVDSPLSDEGCEQAQELQKFIETENSDPNSLTSVLKGIEGESILVSSNLRRALSTCTIAMWERLQRSQEKIHILSSLQEVTFNIDGVCLAKPQGYPELCDEEVHAFGMTKKSFSAGRYYNASDNDGEKPANSRGIDRIKAFANWCFSRSEPTIIATGHSLYFRYFFDTFLPKQSKHESRKNKMENCAAVKFTIHKGKLKNGKPWFYIDETTIVPLYLGFEKKKTKKSKAE